MLNWMLAGLQLFSGTGGGTGITPHIVLLVGSGSPAGTVSAAVGALYLRSDGGAGTTLYVKESGTDTSGWTAK